MNFALRSIFSLAVSFVVGTAPAVAQDSRPIRIIVITAPGGSADFMARLISERVGTKLARPIIVENKPGAGGNIASAFVAKSPPDGTTLLMTSNNHTINPQIFQSAGYDALKDFVPVIQLTRGPIVLAVGPNNPAANLSDFAAQARKDPLLGSYGTYGVGGAAHLVGEMLRDASSSDLRHVPYRGAGPAIADAIGGQVPSVIVSLASATPQLKAGKLRALAVASAHRWPANPDVPTFAESGYRDVVYDVWLGLLAPAGTDPALIATFNREIAAMVNTSDAKELLAKQGMEPVAGSPADFGKFLVQESALTGAIIKRNGITAD